jgi:dienelactone hydrolase
MGEPKELALPVVTRQPILGTASMKTVSILGWLLLFLFIPNTGQPAQPAPRPTHGDLQLAEYFRTETARLAEACLADVKTIEDWNGQRDEFRRQLSEMLGLCPFPQRTDLKPVVTGRLEHPQFFVEKLHFQSQPGLYVTANLYLPKGLTNRAPTVLYLCGHGPVVKDGISYGNKTAYQHHGAWFARHGYVCLVIDTVQLGEIQGLHHGTYREGMWWWNARGYTPAGVEAWNSIRALDYLASRPDVDTNRFGVTGRSGGGAYSWWLAALDDRIKVVAPVAGITDLHNHVVDGTVEGHCDCMFTVNTYRWDYAQVAALVAPRPLLIANTDNDSIFPLDGVARLHRKVRRIYELHKAADKLGLLISEGGHKDTQDLQLPVLRWFNRHLRGEDPLIESAAVKFFEPEQLKVFQRLPADALNTNIHDRFVPRAPSATLPQSQREWEQQREAWLAELKRLSFAGWPKEAPSLDLEQKFSVTRHGVRLQAHDFTSQTGVRLRLYLAQRSGLARPERVLVNVLGDAVHSARTNAASAAVKCDECPTFADLVDALGSVFAKELVEELQAAGVSTERDSRTLSAERFDEWQRFLQTNKVLLAYVAPRGVGLTAWTRDSRKQTHLRRRFMLLGQTLDGMRVWDIRRAFQAVRSVRGFGDKPIVLRASGAMGVNALYASLFEPHLAGLDLWELPASHAQDPDYLNVLRVFDLPQAAAMAAERTAVRLHQVQRSDWEFVEAVAQRLSWQTGKFQIE